MMNKNFHKKIGLFQIVILLYIVEYLQHSTKDVETVDFDSTSDHEFDSHADNNSDFFCQIQGQTEALLS